MLSVINLFHLIIFLLFLFFMKKMKNLRWIFWTSSKIYFDHFINLSIAKRGEKNILWHLNRYIIFQPFSNIHTLPVEQTQSITVWIKNRWFISLEFCLILIISLFILFFLNSNWNKIAFRFFSTYKREGGDENFPLWLFLMLRHWSYCRFFLFFYENMSPSLIFLSHWLITRSSL